MANLSSPLVPPLGDNDRLVALIAEATREPEARVRERLYREEKQLGWNVASALRQAGIRRNVWSDDLVRFYQATDAFLYESVAWGRNPRKLAIRQWIGAYLARVIGSEGRVLVYGDGPGFDSAYLARSCFRVTYYDVSDLSRAFAMSLLDQFPRNAHVVNDASSLKAGIFDAVLCLDVLEHVPEPEQTVAALTQYLRPGGCLIVHAPFYLTAGRFVTHLDSNRWRYSGRLHSLYERAGLFLESGRLFWDPLVLRKVEPGSAGGSSRAWKLLLRMMGGVQWGARFWSAPYTLLADLLCRPDPRWQDGLQPEESAE